MSAIEQNILVLQGGGALGAYQAGAFQQLAENRIAVDWAAAISIGAINAAIICGNPPAQRVEKLRAFWDEVTSTLAYTPAALDEHSRRVYSELAAAEVAMAGAPGFFRPRPPIAFWLFSAHQALSVYDTSPLERTLSELVDFDYLNGKGPRLSVGAVDIETGNFAYFDSNTTRIDTRHVMASAALPPGFPPIEIDGRHYWDGGLVSNTPLQYVMENVSTEPLCIFQVDLFSARGRMPESIAEVQQRENDIRYSSRTRLTTDRYRHLHGIRAAAERLALKLPMALRSDPDLEFLRTAGPSSPVTLVHLIHRKEGFEGNSKDYEFSRLSMSEHWEAGMADMKRTLSHGAWQSREVGKGGLQVFDLSAASGQCPQGARK
jgi:NTE family protein